MKPLYCTFWVITSNHASIRLILLTKTPDFSISVTGTVIRSSTCSGGHAYVLSLVEVVGAPQSFLAGMANALSLLVEVVGELSLLVDGVGSVCVIATCGHSLSAKPLTNK